jgi:DivIVA domain-containing protein
MFVVQRTFTLVRRGYDPAEVDRHLENVSRWFTSTEVGEALAHERTHLEAREAEVERAVAGARLEAEATVEGARRRAEADAERTVAAAREEAERITATAREEARAEADRIVAAARSRAEEEAREYVERRRREADRLVARSRRGG